MRAARSPQFDARSPWFEEIARAYREAVKRADELLRRLPRANGDEADALEAKLRRVEAEIEAARERLTRHRRETAVATPIKRSKFEKTVHAMGA